MELPLWPLITRDLGRGFSEMCERNGLSRLFASFKEPLLRLVLNCLSNVCQDTTMDVVLLGAAQECCDLKGVCLLAQNRYFNTGPRDDTDGGPENTNWIH